MFDWMTGLIDALGAPGVALLMFLENVFPPIPSELVMPLAGFNAATGKMNLVAVILAGAAGSLAGAWFWYWLALKLGRERLRDFAERHGRWTGITPEDLDRSHDWFQRHGAAAVLFGRMIPTVRTFISVPAGLSRMPVLKFLGFSLVGTAIWTTLLAMAGYWLQSGYDAVAHWLDPVSWVVLAAIVGFYIWQVVTYDSRRSKAQEKAGLAASRSE
ncbi:DedA family protein [Oceaniglobus roseus]|uniref:DedA family protein n=1 Tax=Oceaniglobus roseus TaxID=1737570 RepID=UPI000C7EDE6C|nr:DedA family protein [Kandeliimicrobium roseum]